MPKVPVLNQTQRLRAGNPTGFQGTRGARVRGESISQFGRGLASVGGALQTLNTRQDAAEERLASADYKQALTKQLQNLKAEVADRPSTSAKEDVEFYDQRVAEIKDNLGNVYGEKYQGRFSGNFDIVGRELSNGVRGGVLTNSFKRRQVAINDGIKQNSLATQDAVFNDPSGLGEALASSEVTIGGAVRAFGANDDQVAKAVLEERIKYTNAAVSGLMNQSRFDEASAVVNNSKTVYNVEQRNAMLKQIRTTSTTVNREVDRQNRVKEAGLSDLHKKQQEATAMNLAVKISQAKTPAQTAAATSALYKEASAGNIAFAKFGGLKSRIDKSGKQQDAMANLELSQLASEADTPKKVQAVRDRLMNMISTGDIGPEKAAPWFERLKKQESHDKLNPRIADGLKIAHLNLQSFGGTDEGFTARFLKGDKTVAQQARAMKSAKASLDRKVRLEGMAPDVALAEVTRTFFRGVKSVPSFPGYDKPVTNQEELKSYRTWAEKNLHSEAERDEAQSYMLAIKAEFTKVVDFKNDQTLKAERVSDEKLRKAAEETGKFFDTEVDFDILMESSEEGLIPPILRSQADASQLIRR